MSLPSVAAVRTFRKARGRPERVLGARVESMSASISGAAARTVASGPVSLKNQRPLGASTIAPMSRAPCVEAARGAPGMAIGWYEPATSTLVTVMPPTRRVVFVGGSDAGSN